MLTPWNECILAYNRLVPEIVAAHAFPDHAPFAPRALRRLEAEAAQAGARMVTTEKDAVRLPSAFRGKAMPLPVELRLVAQAEFRRRLEKAVLPRNGRNSA